MRLVAVLLVVLALSGCTGADRPLVPTGGSPTLSTPTPDPRFPPLHFGGQVVDALSGAPVQDADVHLDLAAMQPCRREGIVWNQDAIPRGIDGRFGPFEAQRPRTDDFAYYLHVAAPGYAENVTFVGPAEAQRDLGNLTIVLHPDAAIEGRAPPGTVLALDAPGAPRLTVADANGTFRFAHARVLPAWLVAALEAPQTVDSAAPDDLTFEATNASGWRLQGVVKAPSGASLVADLVARNASGALVSAARSSDDGLFTLPLAAHPDKLSLEARTADGRYLAILPVTVDGPPATRLNVLTRAQC